MRRPGAAVKVVQAGPGLGALEHVTAATRDRMPSGLVSFGFAGGLAPQLPPGTILLPRHIRRGTGPIAAVDPEWHGRVLEALLETGNCSTDDLLAVDAIIHRPAEKAGLHAQSGAGAVDLESGVLAAIAAGLGVPFLVLRVILDGAGDALPRSAARMLTPAGGTRLLPTLLTMVRSPAAFARLLRRHRRAARGLQHALAAAWPEILSPPSRPAARLNGTA